MRARSRFRNPPFFRRLLPLVALFGLVAPLANAAWLEGNEPAAAERVAQPRYTPTPWIEDRWLRPTPPPIRYYDDDASARAVRNFLASASLGGAQGWGALTIYPVTVSSGTPSASMRSLDASLRSGALRVYEQGSGSVPSVLVENVGSAPVFLMAGEIVLGGKQDRVIREDMIIPPRSGPMDVPVYCVEQGRWTSGVSFKSAPEAMADGELRAQASAGAGQDAIWSHVARKSAAAGVSSSTSAYREYEQSPEVSRRLDEYVTRCPRPSVWRGRVVGAVFVADGQVLGVDLFSDPALLSALWPKLVRSYAGQVYDGRNGTYGSRGGDSAARAALSALQAAWPQSNGWAGGGVRLSLSVSGMQASAVAVGGAVAHVGALSGYSVQSPPPPPIDDPYPRPWYPRPDE